MAKKTTNKSSSTPKKPSTARKPAKSSVKVSAKAPSSARQTVKKSTSSTRATTKTTARSKSKATVVETKPVTKAASAKPARNGAGLTAKDLAHFRELLLAKRRELLGDVTSMENEALRSSGGHLSSLPIHMADMGTDNYEQEFTLGLVAQDRRVLRDIQAALAKIENGTYGICEGTGKPISKARLEAQPWTRYSIEYARKLEQKVRPG